MMGFENREQRAKRVMKDVIFTEAFKEKKNILELYNQLHADDTTDNEDDIGVLTLRSILATTPINDLGFVAKNKVICLVEAQSSQLNTVLLRSLVYLGRTYERYLANRGRSFYNVTNEDIPVWEIYIVYTEKAGLNGGAQMWYFDMIPNDLLDLDHKKVIPITEGGMVEEYVSICRTIDNLITEHGYDNVTLEGVIKYCREKPGTLANFILEHESEIMGLYEEMWTEEGNREMLMKAAVEEARAEGEAKAKNEITKEIALSLYRLDVPLKTISESTGLSENEIKELASSYKTGRSDLNN